MASSKMSEPISDVIDFVVNKGHGVKGLVDIYMGGLERVPEQYIQPLEERLVEMKIMSRAVTEEKEEESIPVIDVSDWDDPKVGESICEAANKLGFFQIINHGVALEVLEEVKEAGHRFFSLPDEERRKYLKENSPTDTVQLKTSFNPHKEKVLEWKDHLFHIYAPQHEGSAFWPPVSKDQVLEYMKLVKPIIKRLLKVLMKGLNIVKEMDDTECTEEEEETSMLMDSLFVNLIYYPKCPNPELTAGAGRHSDVSTITVLLQDDTGGLYVRGSNGYNWIHVTPMKGALVINIGDVFQILSNGRYKSVEHRVIVSASKNRVSVPIFVNPRPNSVIGPLQQVLLESEERPVYKQLLYSEYLTHFFSKAHDGKQTIEFAKI